MKSCLFSSRASFLIRIWKDSGESCWTGQIEHIQTGDRESFVNLESIPGLCACMLEKNCEGTDHEPEAPEGPEEDL